MAENCRWDDEPTIAFIDVMSENIDELTSSIFKAAMFRKFADEIFIRCNVSFAPNQLTAKYNRLRTEWRKYKWLLNQTGLGYDTSTGAISATDEQWKALESRQEGVSKFKKGAPLCYDKLSALFTKSTATGGCARSASVRPPNSDEERQMQQNLAGMTFSQSEIGGLYRDTAASPSSGPSNNSGKRKERLVSPERGSGSGKKPYTSSSTVEMLTQLWASKELEKEAKKQARQEAAQNQNDRYSIPNCIEILNTMNLEPALFYRAIDVFDNPNRRQAFITMNPELRYGWLLSFS